ncbi:Mannosyl-oligosaccharide 1,2-alpha-mannosidase MNS1 [Cyphellophora attinorum]|uniref:alpha-1,2-Mannosidase n=1 Tax=Cyphellophora attinorum TaxID=1664694 RepID=A0A0N1HN14_9EURO|nr:Mannosyl-oligosaccharide 1,2-alpha-mannosidase MNS1 [Phialophora attinorum]KPI38772.1 Mannosyl-oligosaccharide 1,2-alpha-mannosidase MNS1 [Phialophora attinorum]
MKRPTFSIYGRRKLERYAIALISIYCCFKIFDGLLSSPGSQRLQHAFPRKSYVQLERQQAVKKEFLHAWDGYRDHSWMADGLMPLSGGSRTQFCSWSATLVDALDTLLIMDLKEEFDYAVNATMTIHFRENANQCEVSLFESTIRYLGGLLGAYDLSHEPRLLPKLVEVGDMLHGAFATTNDMPCSFCHLADVGEVFTPSNSISMADIGSLYLEFSRLSQLTGDAKYQQSVEKVLNVFAETQNDSTIPGLWPEIVDASSVSTSATPEERMFARASSQYSLGALSDSSYEYLVKGHLMLGNINTLYAQLWKPAAEKIKDFMLFRSHIPGAETNKALFSGIISRVPGNDQIELEPRAQHLGCFAGGMFAMSSKLFDAPEEFEIGKQLTQGCVWAYDHSPTGIMPETFSLLPCDDLDTGGQCPWNETLWRLAHDECVFYEQCTDPNVPLGYMKVGDPKYILRPEAIESVFIMWRMTGDEYWRDVGWKMFQTIIHHTRTPFGHSALSSVMYQWDTEVVEQGVKTMVQRAGQTDDMESFWFAETLKYFYLLFSDVDLISLDEFVLNTEAHAIRLVDGIRGFGGR